MEEHKIDNFKIDSIPNYLNQNKKKLIDMSIPLDRYEISNSLTISLGRMLMGNKTKLSDLYDDMVSNYEEYEKKIKLIEDNIFKFNSEQKSEYFIDIEKIIYLVFFKQIVYVRKVLEEVDDYIDSNINLVFIYSYLISKLYNDPINITSNYIFIIERIIIGSSFKTNHSIEFSNIINLEILEKIFLMIKMIYNSDFEFSKLVKEFDENKMEEYKKNNQIDYSDSIKELENEARDIKGGGVDMYKIEENFKKKKNFLLIQKRKINIDDLFSSDEINKIIDGNLSLEMWFGFNLFIYKRFDFDFEEYKNKINKYLETKGFETKYYVNLNYLNDIEIPDAGIVLVGGNNINFIKNNITDKIYYLKYIKYKNKYLKLKKII